MRYTNYYPNSGMYHVSLPQLMGTRLDVLLFDGDHKHAINLWERIEPDIKRLEKMLNRFDFDSEVAKVNSDALFSSVQLSDELWDILLDCKRYYELTEGCFDITLSDFGSVIFTEGSHSIGFEKYGLKLDFGGYAKGYALKCVRKHLEEAEIKRALINFGNSSVLAVGSHPYGDNWPVGIEDPSNGNVIKTVNLCDTSMSVSGNSPANKQHIINMSTSEYVVGDVLVAVVADDPVDAEILTTAWVSSGQSDEPGWMKQFNLKNTYKIR